jgi:excisionase family DNA binding protein
VSLPPEIEAAQRRLAEREEALLNNPGHRTNMDEARKMIRATGEADGPHVAANRAEQFHNALMPALPSSFDYLMGRVALTVKEVAPALGISERSVWTAIKRGEIPSTKIAGKRLIPLKALERHLEALAYTESGALDTWETMLAKAASTRLQRARREAYNARKELRRKMKEVRRRAAELSDTPGAARDVAEKVVAELAAARASLTLEEAIASKAGQDLLSDIEQLQREFGLTEQDLLGEDDGEDLED